MADHPSRPRKPTPSRLVPIRAEPSRLIESAVALTTTFLGLAMIARALLF